ncbi:MAG: hypothetical protein ABIR59_10625 [Gemmatimonadales bacterium]
MIHLIRTTCCAALLGAALGCAAPIAVVGQDTKPAAALSVVALSGQRVPVLPMTYLVADAVAGVPAGHADIVAWADSIIGEALEARGPEVQWVLAPALRSTVRRAPTMLPPPDNLGQAVLRSSGIDRVPDPLRIHLRALAALTNSRMIMVPAAARFSNVDGGVQAEVDFVLADARNGSVVWRSRPTAVAATAGDALRLATQYLLPDVR